MFAFKYRALLVAMACAQTAHAAEPFASDSPWALGDWNGTRSDLAQQGIDFEFGYVGEIGANLGGGYNNDRTASYSDQYSLGARLDLEKLLGWHDAHFQLTVANRNGDNISNDRAGTKSTWSPILSSRAN